MAERSTRISGRGGTNPQMMMMIIIFFNAQASPIPRAWNEKLMQKSGADTNPGGRTTRNRRAKEQR